MNSIGTDAGTAEAPVPMVGKIVLCRIKEMVKSKTPSMLSSFAEKICCYAICIIGGDRGQRLIACQGTSALEPPFVNADENSLQIVTQPDS